MNKIKQPKPKIEASAESSTGTINAPYVGIISDINPTKTPISDTIEIKKTETTAQKFKPIKIKNMNLDLNNFATGGIIICGILSLLSLIKRK